MYDIGFYLCYVNDYYDDGNDYDYEKEQSWLSN
jgi:hypothetical protein